MRKRLICHAVAACALLAAALPAEHARAQLRGVTSGGGIGSIAPGIGSAAPGIGSTAPNIGSAAPGIGNSVSGGGAVSRVPDVAPVDRGAVDSALPSTYQRDPFNNPLNGRDPFNNPLTRRDSVTNTLDDRAVSRAAAPPVAAPAGRTKTGVSKAAAKGVSKATRGTAKATQGVSKAVQGPARRVSRVPPARESRFIDDEVLVGLPSNLSQQALDALARRHRLAPVESQTIGLTGTTFHRWRITDQRSVAEVVRALERDRGVNLAQPNYRFTLQQATPRDGEVHEAEQYAPAKLHIPQAHQLATGGRILIAVIDSGIDLSHPELAGTIAGSFDATGRPGAPSYHGTGMAGAIAGHKLIVGIAPDARILAIRAFAPEGNGDVSTTLTILRAIDWAVEHGARVINMSFAGPSDPEIANSLAAASKKGIVLVAAAGNTGARSAPLFPAADAEVIAVAATDTNDQLFAMSVHGKHIALAAPGVDILVPAPQGTYQLSTGTSVAAAHVSGLVALLLELDPHLSPKDVRQILLDSAADLGPVGRDDGYGAGLADAYRALQSLSTAAARGRGASADAR